MRIETVESERRFFELVNCERNLVVDFFSTECPPCEKLAPIYERASEIFTDFKFVKIFRQGNRGLAERLGVSGSPTVLFYKEGKMQDKRFSGEISEKELMTEFEKLSELRAKNNELAETRDLCIIGTGPAGLTAAIYAARYKVDQVLVGELTGGTMTSSHKICNYPSEIEISGMDLSKKMWEHVVNLNVPYKNAGVSTIKKEISNYLVTLTNGETINAKTVLLATGTKHKHLGLPNEEKLTGRGVSYCATCDAAFFTNKKVAVVGGSDSANTASLYLANIASEVYQIHRGENLRGETAWVDQVKSNPKIKLMLNTDVSDVIGEKALEAVELKDSQGTKNLNINGLFIEIGSEPDPFLIKQLELETDDRGYIQVKQDQSTSKIGVWAAGDITTGSNGFRQIITACSEGAVAAQNIFTFLQAGAKNR
jgi:thioredoxin reductase (NADPH)